MSKLAAGVGTRGRKAPGKHGRARRGRTCALNPLGGDPVELIRQVQAGFPFSRLEEFQRRSGFSREKIAQFTAIPRRTVARRQRARHLHADESDRLLRVVRIFELTVGLFAGDLPAARRWLETAQAGLGGAAPLEFASTEVGAREVERLIGRLEHGVIA